MTMTFNAVDAVDADEHGDVDIDGLIDLLEAAKEQNAYVREASVSVTLQVGGSDPVPLVHAVDAIRNGTDEQILSREKRPEDVSDE